MSYCVSCRRYLNGAVSCAGCGAAVSADGQPTVSLPVVRVGGRSSSVVSGSESLPAGGSRRSGSRPESGDQVRVGLGRGRSWAVVVVVAVVFAAGVVFFVTATGGRRPNSPVSAGTMPAGPGVPSPVASVRVGGLASGRPASAAAGVGASGSTSSGVPSTWASGTGGGGVLGGGPTPQTSVLPPSVPPPTSTGGAGGCTATYSLAGSWAGGFQAGVTVADSGSSRLNGWTVELTLASGQSISSLWGGVASGTAGSITVGNASYNGTVAPGGTATFGFTATGKSAAAPTSIGCVDQ